MGCITKFLGRLLFVTLLVSSTYLHISKPQDYVDSFTNYYNNLNEWGSKHLAGLITFPAADAINWNIWIQIYGAFQGLIALLIIGGDGLGGVLLFLSLIVSGSLKYCQICNFLQWEVSKQVEFAQFLTMVGASLILICSNSRSCNKPCNKPCNKQSQESNKQSIKEKSN